MSNDTLQDEARGIVALARLLAGETVDGINLAHEPDTMLAQNLARTIRLKAKHIEDYLKNPM